MYSFYNNKVDPSFKVVARAYPHVLSQLLRDRSPEMRHILGSLIVDPEKGQIRWKRLEAMIRAANVRDDSSEDTEKTSKDKTPKGGQASSSSSSEFSSDFSIDVASALTDALDLVCMPRNGKMRRMLIKDSVEALDRIIDEILTGKRQTEEDNGNTDSNTNSDSNTESDSTMNSKTNSDSETDSTMNNKTNSNTDSNIYSNTEGEDGNKSSPPPPPPSPDAINGALGRFCSLVKAAPGPWTKLAVELLGSKEGNQFCSQLTHTVMEKSSWRGGQWMIFATANALHKEHESWKKISNPHK